MDSGNYTNYITIMELLDILGVTFATNYMKHSFHKPTLVSAHCSTDHDCWVCALGCPVAFAFGRIEAKLEVNRWHLFQLERILRSWRAGGDGGWRWLWVPLVSLPSRRWCLLILFPTNWSPNSIQCSVSSQPLRPDSSIF